MQGRDTFDRATADRIRGLLNQTRNAERAEQKGLRHKIRRLGFYISDFDPSGAGFTPDDFDDLIRDGRIKIA